MEFVAKQIIIDPHNVGTVIHPNRTRNMALLFQSLQFPLMEASLITTVKDFVKTTGDNKTAHDIARELIAQEGRHAKAHRDFNHAFEASTGQDLSFFTNTIGSAIRFLSFKGDKRRNMTMVLLGETLGQTIGRLLQESTLMSGLQGESAKLFRWHFSEEVLHAPEIYNLIKAGGYNPGFITRLSACLRWSLYCCIIPYMYITYAKKQGFLNGRFFKDLIKLSFVEEKAVIYGIFGFILFLFKKPYPISDDIKDYCLAYLAAMPPRG